MATGSCEIKPTSHRSTSGDDVKRRRRSTAQSSLNAAGRRRCASLLIVVVVLTLLTWLPVGTASTHDKQVELDHATTEHVDSSYIRPEADCKPKANNREVTYYTPDSCDVGPRVDKRKEIRVKDFKVESLIPTEADNAPNCTVYMRVRWTAEYSFNPTANNAKRTDESAEFSGDGNETSGYGDDDEDGDESESESGIETETETESESESGASDDYLAGFTIALFPTGIMGSMFCAVVQPAAFNWSDYQHHPLVLHFEYSCFQTVAKDDSLSYRLILLSHKKQPGSPPPPSVDFDKPPCLARQSHPVTAIDDELYLPGTSSDGHSASNPNVRTSIYSEPGPTLPDVDVTPPTDQTYIWIIVIAVVSVIATTSLIVVFVVKFCSRLKSNSCCWCYSVEAMHNQLLGPHQDPNYDAVADEVHV